MKKMRIISTILIFGLCFVTHNLYTWIPSLLVSIFFPVNESIWEHMKMLFTTILIYHLFEYIYLFLKGIKVNNYCIASFTCSFISIPIYLLIFLPFYYSIGDNMIIIFIILFITIYLTQILHSFITNIRNIKYQNILSTILIIICYIIFGYLTYNPPKTSLFFDTKEEKYGINIYNI